jgi:hypothetical protein
MGFLNTSVYLTMVVRKRKLKKRNIAQMKPGCKQGKENTEKLLTFPGNE